MGIMEYADCANARGTEYRRAFEYTEEHGSAAAEEFWIGLKRWVDEVDPWVLALVSGYFAGNRTVIVDYVNRALGVVMSAAALEVAVAVVLGVGLGIAIDLVRECGDQLVV